MKDTFKITGLISIKLHDAEGNLKDERLIKNVITNASLAEVSGLIGDTGSKTAFTYLAVGTGTTAADAGDTALEAEITDTGLERASATVSQQTTTQTDDTLRLSKAFTATGAKAVTETGALNAGAAGTLLGHQVFAAVNVANGDVLTIQYNFIFS